MTTTTNPPPNTSTQPMDFWMTIYVDRNRAYSMPHTRDDFVASFRASTLAGSVILGNTKPCLPGHNYELGDVESVSAITIEIFNDDFGCGSVIARNGAPWAAREEWRRGEPEPRPTQVSTPQAQPFIRSAADVQAALPYSGITYTRADNLNEDCPRAMAVLFLGRPHLLAEAHRLREWLRECIWTSSQIGYVDFADAICMPAERQWSWLPYWYEKLHGPALDVSMVPSAFVPETPFVEPATTNAAKRQWRLEQIQKKVDEFPVLIDLVGKSDLLLHLRLKPEDAKGLELHLASNVAPLLRPMKFDNDGFEHCCSLARALLSDLVDEDGWRVRVNAALDAALRWKIDDPAPWWTFPRALQNFSGPTQTLLRDVLLQAERGRLGHDRWLYIAREHKLYLRDDKGRLRDDEPLLLDAARHRLQKTLSKELVLQFLNNTDQVEMRDAVFSSTADIAVVDGLAVYNMYRPSTVTPQRCAYPDIEALIRNIVGDEKTDDAHAYVFQWVAGIMQALRRGEPKKWLTYLLLQSVPGSGKGFFIRILRELIGPANVVIADQARMESQFTPIAKNTLLFVGNEIHASARKDRAIADNIKRIVTDDTIMVERKFEQARELANVHMNFIMTTNDARPIHLAHDDRRASVFRSSRRLPIEVARALVRDLNGDRMQLRGFLFELLHARVDLADDALFLTSARSALIGHGMSKLDGFIARLQQEGYGVLYREYCNATTTTGAEPESLSLSMPNRLVIPVSTLLAVARFHCPANRGHELTSEALAAAIKTALPSASNDNRHRVKGGDNPTKHWTGIPYAFDDSGACTMKAGDAYPPTPPQP